MNKLEKWQKFAYRGAHNSSINKVIGIDNTEGSPLKIWYIDENRQISGNSKTDGVKVILIT